MVICFKHPHYRGFDKPEISCRSCCRIFIERVKKVASQSKTPLSFAHGVPRELRTASMEKP